MTSHYVVSAIRRHWLLVAATTIFGGFFAAVYAFTATPEYVASTKMFIAAQPPVSPEEAYTGSQFASSRMASYVDLVTGHALAARTVERLHLGIAADDLARKVSATVNPGSVIVKLSITDSSPEAAQDPANAVSEDFVAMVQELEPATPGGDVAARAMLIQRADDARWISPDRRLIVPLGIAVGLLIGIVVALFEDSSHSRHAAGRQQVTGIANRRHRYSLGALRRTGRMGHR